MADALALESLGARARRFAFPVPDALLALIFALAALVDFLPDAALAHIPHALLQGREELVWVLMVEGGFLMMQGTLVDIATRLKKRPPVWLIVLIVGGVLLFGGGHAWDVLKIAWQRGLVVFIPLLLSLGERGYLLWQMPVRTRVQKIAARALISNRIITGLALLAVFVVMLIVSMSTGHTSATDAMWPVLAAGALYFAIAAYDDYRVRQKKFADAPRVLFRYDVLGIDYLAPL
ncbi:MAG TPA: hypothetical protein VF266_18605 [Thermoanaerobaculia bacterium]